MYDKKRLNHLDRIRINDPEMLIDVKKDYLLPEIGAKVLASDCEGEVIKISTYGVELPEGKLENKETPIIVVRLDREKFDRNFFPSEIKII